MNEDVNNNEQENDYSSFMPKENQEPAATPPADEAPVEPVSESSSTGYGFERENTEIVWVSQKVNELRREFSNYVIGQHEMVELLLTGIFANGHILLEGVPGIAKTLSAKVIAKALDIHFSRIQFTPDMMPSDVIGTSVYNMKDSSFIFNKGPVFANVVLIDEINRAPAKTQSALFEVMEERQITYDGQLYPMDFPFLVVATQNPVDQEGTYNLPEAQLDRFMFNIWVDYPSYIEELAIVKATTSDQQLELKHILSAEQIMMYQELIRRIPVADNVMEYAVKLVGKTRFSSEFAPQLTKDFISWGAGPRASQYLIVGAKCHAALNGKYSPDIEDVKAVAKPILRHRIVRNYKAEAEGYSTDRLIDELL